MKKNEKFVQFPSFMSEPHSTIEHQIQDLYASLKVPFFSSLRRTETHFRHQRSHKRAEAILGFISNFQRTTTAVNRVEHQKTVNIEKKFEKGIIGFHK